MEITEQSPLTAADPLPEISELSTEKVTEESALINSKEQNLQPQVKNTATQTQQDEQKVQITGNLCTLGVSPSLVSRWREGYSFWSS